MKFQSSGNLHYGEDNKGFKKLILNIDQGIVDFYRYLIPKSQLVQPQAYSAHISVIRRENIPKMEFWGKYEGETASFKYETVIYKDGTYFWLEAYSEKLNEIRLELGLPKYRGNNNCFHITLGNRKLANEKIFGKKIRKI